MSVVRIREGPYYTGYFLRKHLRILSGHRKLSVIYRGVRIRKVSVKRGSTVLANVYSYGNG